MQVASRTQVVRFVLPGTQSRTAAKVLPLGTEVALLPHGAFLRHGAASFHTEARGHGVTENNCRVSSESLRQSNDFFELKTTKRRTLQCEAQAETWLCASAPLRTRAEKESLDTLRCKLAKASRHAFHCANFWNMVVKDPKTLLSSVLRSLRHRNFRLFTVGQSISLIGTWMQQVAVGWLVYTMTDSALLLGLVSFAAQGPTFVLAPLAGAIADRGNRRRLLLIVQSLMMVQALALAALVLSGKVEIWHIVALSAMLGCLSGFDIPIRQSFLVEMVEGREDLSNAIALNSSMFNGGAAGGTGHRRVRDRARR